MERSVEIDTGESVAFSYELAGLGSRFLAVLFDTAIQLAVAIVLALLLLLFVITLGPRAGFLPARVLKLGASVLSASAIAAGFLLFFGYFIFFEWRWNGKTPGKRIVGIRVVRDGGFPVDFIASTTRNLVRIVEATLGFYLFAGISALLSPRNRRLGDYAAGTIVVRDVRFERAALGSRRADDPLVLDLEPRELDLIEQFLSRRDALVPGARAVVAGEIASRVRPKLRASFDHLDDEALLEHICGRRI